MKPKLEYLSDGRKGRYWPGVSWIVTGPDNENGGAVAAYIEELFGAGAPDPGPEILLGQAYLRAATLAYNDAQKWTPGKWIIKLNKTVVWVDE